MVCLIYLSLQDKRIITLELFSELPFRIVFVEWDCMGDTAEGSSMSRPGGGEIFGVESSIAYL